MQVRVRTMPGLPALAGSRTRRHFAIAIVMTLLAGAFLSASKLGPILALPPHSSASLANMGNIPLYFEPNVGQADQSAGYIAHAHGGTFFFTGNEVILYAQQNVAEEARPGMSYVDHTPSCLNHQWRATVHMQFVGASDATRMEPGTPASARINYFIGNNPATWHTNVPTYSGMSYTELYPGIDLSYGGAGGQLKGTYSLAAGVSPDVISWRYEGAQSVTADDEGNLLITLSDTQAGDASLALSLTEQAPIAWQEINGSRTMVPVAYNLRADRTIGFTLGYYDRAYPLTIDPTLILTYSTYLGGNAYDVAQDIAVDSAGNAYITGVTSSTDFPLRNNYQADQPSFDAFVSKLNTTLSGNASLIYSTYLGGSGIDYGHGIDVDSSGSAYVTGRTDSTDFPTVNQYQGNQGNSDAFVTRLNTTGSSLSYSSYLGGSGSDEPFSIAIGNATNAYITGMTASPDFPTLNGYQSDQAFGDVFVARLDTATAGNASLIYSTYLGGDNIEYGYGIAVGVGGNAYVTGMTVSTDFPTLNQAQSDQISNDAFITRLNTNLSGNASLIYSSYLGGNDVDYGWGIAAAGSGIAYVGGSTESTDFPIAGQYQSNQPDEDGFLTRIDTTLSGLPSIIYSTYLGGVNNDSVEGVEASGTSAAYLVGSTSSPNFPLRGQYQAFGGNNDVFVSKLDTLLAGDSSLTLSTYLGGSGYEEGYGIAVDTAGYAYVTGYTLSTDFPMVRAYQGDQTSEDGFVSKFGLATDTPTPVPTATGTSTNTPTRTRTATASRTSTPSATLTPTRSATPSSTSTRTATVAPTQTPSGPSATPQPTNTNTATLAPTNTSTRTTTPTQTTVPTNTGTAWPTHTPSSATATLQPTNTLDPTTTAPTATPPSPSPTACAVSFVDVPTGHTFYQYVQCLACRGIVSGYSDGTFRPNENVTRGQISKIVSNAAGFQEPVTGRSFEDVAEGSTFYSFIERLASRGVISGYECGSAGEPCIPPGNHPYFRPGGNATRGQLSKIVCRAATCNGAVSGQTFEDVPPSHTFYIDVEHLYGLGSINGYPCGSPEPCVPPDSRPYFRPGSNVTRGQTSKIVSNTFFPNCQVTNR